MVKIKVIINKFYSHFLTIVKDNSLKQKCLYVFQGVMYIKIKCITIALQRMGGRNWRHTVVRFLHSIWSNIIPEGRLLILGQKLKLLKISIYDKPIVVVK